MGRLPEQYNSVAPSVLVVKCTKRLLKAFLQTNRQEMPAVPLLQTNTRALLSVQQQVPTALPLLVLFLRDSCPRDDGTDSLFQNVGNKNQC